MPTTKRWVVHGVQGRNDCINYVKNPKKTEGGTLVSGLNCSPDFASYEMKINNDKFHIEEDNESRTCYHAYQSFDPKEKNLTPEQVHEMGVELAKRLYPNFQVLVCTHTDRFHLHNHFVINAVSTEGRKLEDRLANPIEGLYGLRDMSDTIALEHGLKIIEDAPKIGYFHSNKYLYAIASKTWKKQIIEKLEELKESCFSFDELLENLALDGYQIKYGKNIRIKPYGKQKFVTMKVLGSEYSEDSLKEFFYHKRKNDIAISFENYKLNTNDSELLNIHNQLAQLSKHSVLSTMKELDSTKQYPNYYNSRYLEIKRYHQLVNTINFLNDNEIYNYQSLEEKIEQLQNEIATKEEEYNKLFSINETLQLRVPICNIYLQYLEDYEYFCEQEEMLGEKLEPSNEIKLFLEAKNELEVNTTEEVQEIIASANQYKKESNQQYAYLSYLKTKASELEKIKSISLETSKGFIKSVSISKNMIDYTRSNAEQYCVRIPYTEYYMYVPKNNIAWVSYDKRGIIYLVDDKEYTLYDDKNKQVMTARGEEIEDVSKEEKQKISEYYRKEFI